MKKFNHIFFLTVMVKNIIHEIKNGDDTTLEILIIY